VFGDDGTDETLAILGDGPEIACVLHAKPVLELRLLLSVPRMDLAAVSPGRSKSDAFGLE
jgi:hypothetical protein